MAKSGKGKYKCTFVLIITLPILFLLLQSIKSHPFPNQPAGTYAIGIGPNQCTISIDAQNNEFYYSDQTNGLFIKGTFEIQSEGLLLLCKNKNNINIIEEQIAACDGLTLTMKVNGHAIEFKKISQTPSIVGNISNYS